MFEIWDTFTLQDVFLKSVSYLNYKLELGQKNLSAGLHWYPSTGQMLLLLLLVLRGRWNSSFDSLFLLVDKVEEAKHDPGTAVNRRNRW